jgi:hypothetical protein
MRQSIIDFFTKYCDRMDFSCNFKNCKEAATVPLYRCDGCAKQFIHVSCFEAILKTRSSYGDSFVFCSVACVDSGPLILSSDLAKVAGKLNKAHLKAFLRSKEQRVVDDSGKDVPKNVLIDTLMKYSDTIIESDINFARIRTHKSPHCDFRLLNVLFDDEYAEAFEATGASMTRVELDALNGATEVSFWETVAEAYNNNDDVRFDELLFESEKLAGINPSLFVNHCASKLQQMWKSLNKYYNVARRKYQKSGNHDPDFFLAISEDGDDVDDNFEDFTDYAAVFYLRKHLEQRPGLNELVVRKLDDNIELESSDSPENGMKRRESDVSSLCTSSTRKKSKKYDMGEAFFKLADNRIQFKLDWTLCSKEKNEKDKN